MTTASPYAPEDFAYVAFYGDEDSYFGDACHVFDTLEQAVQWLLGNADGLIENYDEEIGSTDDEKEKAEYRQKQVEIASACSTLRSDESPDRRVSGGGWAFQVSQALRGDI